MSYCVGFILPKNSEEIMVGVKQHLGYGLTNSPECAFTDDESIYPFSGMCSRGESFCYHTRYDETNRNAIEEYSKKAVLSDYEKSNLEMFQNEGEWRRKQASQYIDIFNIIFSHNHVKRIGIVMNWWDHNDLLGEPPITSLPSKTIKLEDFTIDFILNCEPEIIYYVKRD